MYKKSKELRELVSGEHEIGYAKREYMFHQYGDNYMSIMRGIKSVFDTENILNPGKVCQ
jgi:glycolate oxidase